MIHAELPDSISRRQNYSKKTEKPPKGLLDQSSAPISSSAMMAGIEHPHDSRT